MERQPVDFINRHLDGHLHDALAAVGLFIGADPEGLAFVTNTTTAANTILASLELQPGDQIVVTDQTYGAVLHAAQLACDETSAELVTVPIPLPLPDDDTIVAAFVDAIRPQTQLVIVDAVSSPTGAILPAERVARECRRLHVPCFIDAAHAPGLIPVDLSQSAATYWSGNLHKWVCTPKGSAVLFADEGARRSLRPLVTSHSYLNDYFSRFGWTGTHDPTAYLAVPSAIELFATVGWDEVRRRNADLAEEGRQVVATAFDTDRLVPRDRAAAMTLVHVPPMVGDRVALLDLQNRFYAESSIEVPFVAWNGQSYLRLSAQLYNRIEQYERLAEALPKFLSSAS